MPAPQPCFAWLPTPSLQAFSRGTVKCNLLELFFPHCLILQYNELKPPDWVGPSDRYIIVTKKVI